ncbi:MAG: type VI secretion system tube protein Hcp [Azoarcus sp.]|jgi:type VI secretion system secreted protein Hcp|nr:type VI secretion system tube protein Hcp [Azoarcus sp.]
MAFDAFLKIDGIPGESTDDQHKDWIEILSFNHGVHQPVSSTVSSAGGATVERVSFTAPIITKLVDRASPKLFEASFTGKHIKEVIIEVCRAGSNKEKYLEIRMEQVLVSDFNQGGGNEFPVETVSFAPGTIKMIYTQQKRTDGAPSGQIAAGWSSITNRPVA